MHTSYQDVKASVLSRIRKNIWPPGALVPGEIELAQEFGCARATVNRAMRELVDEGILERKRKVGTRVKAAPERNTRFSIPLISEEIAETGSVYRYALVEREIVSAPGWLRAHVGLQKGDEVLHLKCMHFASDRPYQLEDRWINLDMIPNARTQSFENLGPNEWLVREVPFSEAEISYSAMNATRDIAEFLNGPEGEAIMTSQRTTWLEEKNLTHARFYFSSGYNLSMRFH